jgi:predicted N-acetyltransferase YhbS
VDPAAPDRVVLRPMTGEDVPAIAALARAEGRNVGEADHRRFLALEGARGYVLVRDEALIGAATLMRYFEHGFLGPVILDPRADSAGFAIALIAQLIESVQREGVMVIEAEAAQVEEAILGRMGFSTLRRTLVLERPPSAATAPAGSVTMEDHHLLDVGSLDADAVGYGRKGYLAALMRDHPAGARVLVRDGEVSGYALVRRAPHGFQLGPLVTRDPDEAAAGVLLVDALSAAEGAAVVALAPEAAPHLALLERHGFRRVGTLARMRGGTRAAPSETRVAATEWVSGGRITG